MVNNRQGRKAKLSVKSIRQFIVNTIHATTDSKTKIYFLDKD